MLSGAQGKHKILFFHACRRELVLFYHEQESYLVIIEKRDTYALLWTAYPVDRGHAYRKLMKEYEAYKKARTAE